MWEKTDSSEVGGEERVDDGNEKFGEEEECGQTLLTLGVGRAGPGVSRFLLQPWTLAMEGPPSNKLVLDAKPKVTIQVSEPHL